MLKTHAPRNTDLRWKLWLVGALLQQDFCSSPWAGVCVIPAMLLGCYEDPVDRAHGCLPAQGHQISPHIARGQPRQMAELKRLRQLQLPTQSLKNSNQVRGEKEKRSSWRKSYYYFFLHENKQHLMSLSVHMD